MRFPEPRTWTIGEIEAEARIARDIYAARRPLEGREAYKVAHADAVDAVTELLDASDDLADLASTLADRRPLLDVARYITAPPISADDLDTVARFLRPTTAGGPMAAPAKVLVDGIDRDRFPWLFVPPRRDATPEERSFAIGTTAALIAAQRAATVLRNMWAKRQEAAVASLLASKGYELVGPRRIDSLADLPGGTYCPESLVFGQSRTSRSGFATDASCFSSARSAARRSTASSASITRRSTSVTPGNAASRLRRTREPSSAGSSSR